MPRKKNVDALATEKAKIVDASLVLRRAIEGGLLDAMPDANISSYGRGHWTRRRSHAERIEIARLFRSVVETLGVRVYCDRLRAPYNGIRLSLDVAETPEHPAGRLELFPTSGRPRFWEG